MSLFILPDNPGFIWAIISGVCHQQRAHIIHFKITGNLETYSELLIILISLQLQTAMT